MARLNGSDDLYRLIHSLTTEEKGYFKKFALRHTSRGNAYLQLFDAISNQQQKDEQLLKKRFGNYAKLKMYLKDVLVEGLLIYHRNNHPHIALLGQLQKIHLMIIKGLYGAAFTMLGKAIDECRQMELFAITRYLLHLDMELKALTFTDTNDLKKLEESYSSSTAVNTADEHNLTQLELLGLTWLTRIKTQNSETDIALFRQQALGGSELAANSSRAHIKKLSILFYQGFMQNDLGRKYQITKKQVVLVQNFRNKHDASFNIIPILSNHILNCIALKKYAEAELLSNKMIAAEAKVKLYYDLAFTWGNLYKWTSYFHTGRFEKGLDEIESAQAEMLKLYDSISDELRLRGATVYDKIKILFLFGNAKFTECWLFIHDSISTLKHDASSAADILILEMMVQFELGNFELLKSMSVKAQKKLLHKDPSDKKYSPLLGFFKSVSAGNAGRLTLQTLQELKADRLKNNTGYLRVFGLMQYEHWLESKCREKTLQELIKNESNTVSVSIKTENINTTIINEEIL